MSLMKVYFEINEPTDDNIYLEFLESNVFL